MKELDISHMTDEEKKGINVVLYLLKNIAHNSTTMYCIVPFIPLV